MKIEAHELGRIEMSVVVNIMTDSHPWTHGAEPLHHFTAIDAESGLYEMDVTMQELLECLTLQNHWSESAPEAVYQWIDTRGRWGNWKTGFQGRKDDDGTELHFCISIEDIESMIERR